MAIPWGGYEEAKRSGSTLAKSMVSKRMQGDLRCPARSTMPGSGKCLLDFIQKDGINQFKIDGTGNVDSVFPGSGFDSDFAAAIR